MRREVESLERGIREDYLLRSTSDLALQMESQVEALRDIQTEGATDGAEVENEIRRLEAALAALRDTDQ